ncbi:MAG: DUF4870 domain-containing protein [Gammaproteobacteria bacterium]
MSKTALGLDKNTSALIAYVLGWISGLAVILIEKDDEFVRFHAMQSIITFGALTLLSIFASWIFYYFLFFGSIIHIAAVVLWIILMVKAYQGEKFKLPVIGDLAMQWMHKI